MSKNKRESTLPMEASADATVTADNHLKQSPNLRRHWGSIGAGLLVLFAGLGIMAANGWFPNTDAMTGKKTGWFGTELAKNASSSWNPFAAPLPTGTPQLSKEYIYAGSRLLAVEDANAGGTPTPTPTPVPTPYGYEGDVTPRYYGDGAVDTTDISIERQFVAGLITPQAGTNEFQRADASPTAVLGDGSIDSTDIVAVRNYAAGLIPITPAGGPTGPGNAPQTAGKTNGKTADGPDSPSSTNREIRVGPVIAIRGSAVTVPVFLNVDRGELATSFTLEYDTSKLSNPRVSLNNLLPASTVLTTNTQQNGKIAIVVDSETSFSLLPLQLPLVYITFDVPSRSLIGVTRINITDSLAPRSVSDSGANSLTTRYTNGDLTITN